MNVKKLFTLMLPVIIFLFFPLYVSAQYDSEIIIPSYENGKEVFGISTERGHSTIIFFPEGCKSVDKVTVKFIKPVEGKIRVESFGEESPFEDIIIDKPFEYCRFTYSDIYEEDIEELKIDAKVRKSWLEKENVDKENIGLYSFVEDNWNVNPTEREDDNSIYNFYAIEDVEFSEDFAVGEYTEISGIISPLFLLICCIVLIFLLLLLFLIYSLTKKRWKED